MSSPRGFDADSGPGEVVRGHGGFADDDWPPVDGQRPTPWSGLVEAQGEPGAVRGTRGASGDGGPADVRRPGRGRRALVTTTAVAVALVAGVVAGATGREPATVPGPTVTAPAPTVTVTSGRYGQTGQSVADQAELDGIWTVLDGVAPGHYEGRPTIEGGTCHWWRLGRTVDGVTPLLEEVSTRTTTRVRILETDARFASFGCSWYREV